MFKKAVALDELKQQGRLCKTIEERKILFLMSKDKVYAIDSKCPHLKLPLTKGDVTENDTIICPFHKSEFSLNSGETVHWSPWPPVVGPLLGKVKKPQSLTTYPVKVENNEVFIDI